MFKEKSLTNLGITQQIEFLPRIAVHDFRFAFSGRRGPTEGKEKYKPLKEKSNLFYFEVLNHSLCNLNQGIYI